MDPATLNVPPIKPPGTSAALTSTLLAQADPDTLLRTYAALTHRMDKVGNPDDARALRDQRDLVHHEVTHRCHVSVAGATARASGLLLAPDDVQRLRDAAQQAGDISEPIGIVEDVVSDLLAAAGQERLR